MEWNENITGLQHIGIPTNDIEKTVEFYHRIGFVTALETYDGDVKVVFLKLGGLIVETYENGQAVLKDGAIDHMSLNVRDIEEAYRYVTGLGVKVLTEITFLPFWEKGIRFFIIQGPNMERIEFAQYL
ncbi:MAG: VOC family protein [Eubacteriales bacterium]|nr:VOC family protein [Eubacteriales bacterium]